MIPLILTKLTAGTRVPASLDPVGLVLTTGAALALVWGLIRANSLGWASPEVRAHLPDVSIERTEVLQYGDDPEVEPGQLLARVVLDTQGR